MYAGWDSKDLCYVVGYLGGRCGDCEDLHPKIKLKQALERETLISILLTI